MRRLVCISVIAAAATFAGVPQMAHAQSSRCVQAIQSVEQISDREPLTDRAQRFLERAREDRRAGDYASCEQNAQAAVNEMRGSSGSSRQVSSSYGVNDRESCANLIDAIQRSSDREPLTRRAQQYFDDARTSQRRGNSSECVRQANAAIDEMRAGSGSSSRGQGGSGGSMIDSILQSLQQQQKNR
jgi:hypothetical protein